MDEKHTTMNEATDQLNTQEEEITTNENGNEPQAATDEASGNDDGMEKLKIEVEQYKDKYIRLVAEFDNYKRRTAKERIELMQTAGREIIISLLDVLDDCDRAEKQMSTATDIDQVKEGIQLVFNKLRNTLQSKGVKAMESVNTDFDVEKHEAITEVDVPEKSMKGKVIDEVVKGYYLNDKLIRFAKVVVAK